ncbi:MAG: phosphatase PAP2 family protein [Reichenbachiella sp.]
MKRTIRIIVLIVLQTHILQAQTSSNVEVCDMCGDRSHNKSPYNISFKHEIPFLAAGVTLFSTGALLSQTSLNTPMTAEEIAGLDTQDVNSFDRGATDNYSIVAASYSDFFRSSVTLFPLYFLTNSHTKGDLGPLLVMTGEVFLSTYGLTLIAKNTVRRPRPFLYNSEAPMDDKLTDNGTRSFFSGHTSHTAAFSFFMAKVISDYHPNASKASKIVLWSSAAAIPALTGYLRIAAGKHFPTDVMIGYAVGATIGVLIPHWHRKEKKEGRASVFPVFGLEYTGLALVVPLGRK